jgi:hypothetical protein
LRPRCPRVCCWTRWRTSSVAALASLLTRKWSSTRVASCIPTSGSVSAERQGAAGSSAANLIPALQAGLWAASQSRNTLRERPSLMSSGRPRAARSTAAAPLRFDHAAARQNGHDGDIPAAAATGPVHDRLVDPDRHTRAGLDGVELLGGTDRLSARRARVEDNGPPGAGAGSSRQHDDERGRCPCLPRRQASSSPPVPGSCRSVTPASPVWSSTVVSRLRRGPVRPRSRAGFRVEDETEPRGYANECEGT